ncbi:Serine/threonine-protein kinase PrkC [Gemmata obscuriglobus]|uniref:non-specific serine/threonine protein kinase n=1 Tax=Gemmata obscuriglobus TaxID=114 RepID=A0A2Z3H4L4_9BACT|nr:serine/threonine-protein kinase [Gemmata obscuriglobus]AWM39811.1 hypothetical protein C1280_24255 [Gemmata obscuriglobus]QEG27070.1 Serine/threonine-protein kinase PrkC [Gemmata obscuriglobus]VTS03503.1 serine threonine protein kinase : Serine/threonine protein kinase OS=Rhodopirellula sp. SWK7 GN=RRSWK_05792 PE=3 SV=1: Pkinase [Gemmata obscuriglobus UQM 2246]
MSQRYLDVSLIGEGGFGQVYLCTDSTTGQDYAKKKLLPGATPSEVERFVREVRLLSLLDNEHVVKVVGSHISSAPYYFVMPLYRTSLEKELWDISFQPSRAVPIFNRILAGVRHAHEHGVIHRDLKPQNVLMNTDEDCVVSDFGLGRQLDAETTRKTMTGDKMGSLMFSAPEQFADAKDTDVRADVYSLGVIIYILYVGPIAYLDVNHHKIPAHLRSVIRRATRPEREQRYATVAEMQDAWMTVSGQRTTASAVEQMNAVIASLAKTTDATGLTDRLHDLMVSNIDDKKVIFDAVMKLPVQAVALMEARYPDTFHTIIRTFAEVVADPFMNHGFDFMDTIGKQCRRLYDASGDVEVRSEILSCVYALGYGSNRWFVMRLFNDLVQQPKLPGEGMMLAERLQKHTEWQEQAAKQLSAARLDFHLRAFFFPDNPADDF